MVTRSVVAGALALLLMAGCGPREQQPADRSGMIHEGDVCMQLGRERLDSTGHAVRCTRDPTEAHATWKR